MVSRPLKRTHPGPVIEEIPGHKEQHSASFVENYFDITALFNAEGIITSVSSSITPVLGYLPEEIIGCHARILVHPDDLATIEHMLGKLERTAGLSLSAQYRLRGKEGLWQWFEANATNLLAMPGLGAIVSHFRALAKKEPVSYLNGSELSESEHFVQFYNTDEFLLDSLTSFIETGLATGDACFVIATKAHREQLEKRLQSHGLDLALARARGDYFSQDAAETLAQFMVDGSPEPRRFKEVIRNILATCTKSGRHPRIFGEMVMLLWSEQKPAAAISLEALWNDLHNPLQPFSLFCAYSMHSFTGQANETQLIEICQQHSHVIPDESYTALSNPDERLRTITLLQQKAASLEAELVQRKVMEERLRASENRYRCLFEASTDGILLVDPLTGIITDANPCITELLGYTREQLQTLELWQLGLFEDRETNVKVLQQLQEKRFLHYETLSLHTRDGRWREVEFTSTLYQANGHPLIQCSIRDITERKQAEATIQRLFDSTIIGVFVADFAGTFLSANDTFLALLGYSRADLLAGALQRDALTPSEFHADNHRALQALQDTGTSGTYEIEYRQKSGKRIPVLVAMTRIEHTETCIGFVLNISERKALERRKDAFIITASHELRTPLTIVQGYLDLLNEIDDLNPELRRSFLSKARNACDEFVLLLANIMDASRIEADRLDLHCSLLPLKEICLALVALFEPLILLEQRQVMLDIPDHMLVWADEMRLKQILRNLVANALHYSPPRTPISITAALEQDSRMVRICVIDRGLGIPLDKQYAVFDKFVRLERDMQSIVRGSGLGLSISRQLVEAMQGTIAVTSNGIAGEGSCFSFLLPARVIM